VSGSCERIEKGAQLHGQVGPGRRTGPLHMCFNQVLVFQLVVALEAEKIQVPSGSRDLLSDWDN